jgi:CRISPR-associated endonuclease/helicase Cas3
MIARSASLRSRFASLIGVASDAVAPTVGALLALHDIGKLDARFQAKAPDAACCLWPGWEGLRRKFGERYDHGAAGYGHLWRDHKDTVNRQLGEVSWPFIQAVTGHHGRLSDSDAATSAASWRDIRLRGLRDEDRAARCGFLGDAIGLFQARGAALPLSLEPGSPAVVLLAGLCSVADWIGSNTDFFSFVSEVESLAAYYDSHAVVAAKAALSTLDLRGARVSQRSFRELFGFEPLGVQRVTESLPLGGGPRLIIVEAQMGCGKTEAALGIAKRLLVQGSATGVYLALPTMATSNAMLGRLERCLPRMFDGEVNLVLSHGRARLNQAFERIVSRRRAGAAPYEDDAAVVCERWLLGRKRALLGQVGVGTVDQAMLAALRVRHHFVRAFALAESVVVLDEVHAYDAYMQVILDRLVEWLGALGAPVILLSATLPQSKRRMFVEAYARGAGYPVGLALQRPPAEAPYPLVTSVSRDGVTEHCVDEPAVPRTVQLDLVRCEEPEAEILPRLVEAARGGAMVGWIRNTVDDAQRAWEAARELGASQLMLFHARMRGGDRSEVESRVLGTFGKEGQRAGTLLIATQVVEQSLDLDFDLLATDLCPIDLVLQRAGRLHRHKRDGRPAGCTHARLVVVAPEREAAAVLRFGGSGWVYDPATLGLTLGVLQERDGFEVPTDIRGLVEAVYDPGLRAKRVDDAPNAQELRSAQDKTATELEKRQVKARRACVAPAGFDPAAAERYYEDDDEDVQTLTRDGDSTTLLPVLWDGEEGRALDGGEPWKLDALDRFAWQEARSLLEEMVNVPAYPGRRIERGARARGEAEAWNGWLRRAEAFLAATGLGSPVVIPMRTVCDKMWRGSVVTSKGETLRLAYSIEKGLWFRRQEEA